MLSLLPRLQVPLTVYHLHGPASPELASVRQHLTSASFQGHWVLLHGVHTHPPLLSELPGLLEELTRGRDCWRLWLSMEGDCGGLPASILHRCSRVVLDPPKVCVCGLEADYCARLFICCPSYIMHPWLTRW